MRVAAHSVTRRIDLKAKAETSKAATARALRIEICSQPRRMATSAVV